MGENQMFCYQCEQTAKGQGCTIVGVCGKTPDVAALQDLLMYSLKNLSQVAMDARKIKIHDEKVDVFICKALFSTLTNVNFDPNRFRNMIKKTIKLQESLLVKITKAGKYSNPVKALKIRLEGSLEDLIQQGKIAGVKSDQNTDPDIHSLQQLLIYGLKGVAAYASHAYAFGKKDDKVFTFIEEGLVATLDKSLKIEDFIDLVLKCGEINLRAMELLDAGHTESYGHPVPTKVPLGTKKGKAILVSGHDLQDLEMILKQSTGKGIYVYTHGEMLPAHGYPGLKKYPHFYGHYGTAWQNQQKEFKAFPGPILMTTNCLQKPLKDYSDNIFTTGLVGWSGIPHIADKNFSQIIKKAERMPGFQENKIKTHVMVGFGRNAILSVAGKVVEAIKNKKIRHIFMVGGCDGAKMGRSYYSDFVEKTPKDSLILTLACGKFRFFDKKLGSISGLPRILDVGQCNDAYSAIKVTLALADELNMQVNDLPLSLVLSWYEQKAVAILLTLLYLGIKNIRLGPSLPAFITPNILSFLVEKFDIKPIATPEKDLKTILNQLQCGM